MDTAAFDYDLPHERIAQAAIEPRDASRLLVASTLDELPFHALPSLLRPGDLLVVNRTRVRHARLVGERMGTGGSVEIMLTRRIDERRWEALLKPSRRLREGVVICVADRSIVLLADPVGGVAPVAIEPHDGAEDFIESVGSVPLPPYFEGTLDDDERYQTMFAKDLGSSASPTAALHFTPSLVERLRQEGVGFTDVELRIGLDTFRPMTVDTVDRHRIHTEDIVVGSEAVDAIDATRRVGGRVVAVGTTVVRTLETAADGSGGITAMTGPTDLFITPGYRPTVVDALITNFHAPRTTLLVLIAALIGDRWRDVYQHALASGFRFLSFGDAMYIEVDR